MASTFDESRSCSCRYGAEAPFLDARLGQTLKGEGCRRNHVFRERTPSHRAGISATAVPFSARNRIRHLVGPAFLSPQLVEAILQGRHPVELPTTRLTELDLPLDWTDQHKLFES
jgi:hypothetical protein